MPTRNVAIRVDGLGKRYQLGERLPYYTLRDTVAGMLRWPGNQIAVRNDRRGKAADRVVWALHDVSFELAEGDLLGVIGRNGAGKSTLLKLLSRITEPTTGSAEVHGRLGSLLEVGTGFHPELTGRENVYLNAAILGMRRRETQRRFDEIVEFAGVERFIDTPVKYYSSGMYVRLGFSVAVHMEPEILVIDEVLAVGDAEFQRRCFTKMQEVSRREKTIIFVSHNLSAVRRLCHRGLLLDGGRVAKMGPIDEVVDAYALAVQSLDGWTRCETRDFIVEDVVAAPATVKTFEDLSITVQLTARNDIGDPGLYLGILNEDHQRVCGLDFKDFVTAPVIRAGQRVEFRFVIRALPLLPGAYDIEFHAKDMARHSIEVVPQTYRLHVAESPVYGGRKIDTWYGIVALTATADMAALPACDVEMIR